jgi:hypothetical protein
MTGVIGDAREPLDHGRHARQGPQVRGKPVRTGALAERLIDSRQLGWGQFRFPSGSASRAQRRAAPASPGLVPAAHTLSAHSQRAGDFGHDLPGHEQARRLTAAQLQGVEVSACGYVSVHAPIINEGAENVTLFYETH